MTQTQPTAQDFRVKKITRKTINSKNIMNQTIYKVELEEPVYGMPKLSYTTSDEPHFAVDEIIRVTMMESQKKLDDFDLKDKTPKNSNDAMKADLKGRTGKIPVKIISKKRN